MNRVYETPLKRGFGETEEKRSRFLGFCAPVTTEEEARVFFDEIRAAHRDARHVVCAFLLQDGKSRSSDDGEPSGTAGRPVLEAISHAGVSDAAVAVVRYFGGTLLGTGGLVRNYSSAASLALRDAGKAVQQLCVELKVRCDYRFYERLVQLAGKSNGTVLDAQFADQVLVRFRFAEQLADSFETVVSDLTSGTASVERSNSHFVLLEK